MDVPMDADVLLRKFSDGKVVPDPPPAGCRAPAAGCCRASAAASGFGAPAVVLAASAAAPAIAAPANTAAIASAPPAPFVVDDDDAR